MKYNVSCMGSKSVVSVAAVCQDKALREGICTSDYIRNEALSRCMAIPSYKYKSLKWKNLYYDFMRERVTAEITGRQSRMSKYQEGKEKARDVAIDWQEQAAQENYSYEELAAYGEYFHRIGKRYGLLREFQENGIPC